MIALLVIFLTINVLTDYYLFRQAYVVRSNMNRKYRLRFMLLTAVIGVSVFLTGFNLPLACLIAGIPAVLLIIFAIAMFLAAYTHKGPWN